VLVVRRLAHSNAPGSRHPKRYQDIDELLRAGIDVRTALNIQHLESLSDVVTRITGVTVRETVPDTVLDRADEVVLVDITPSELIQRLKDGKVYRADNARRAIDHYFTPGNLTALRELAAAHRRARRDQMVDYLRQNAIEVLETAERIRLRRRRCPLDDRDRAASPPAGSTPTGSPSMSGLEAAPEAGASERIEGALQLAERLGATVPPPAAISSPDPRARAEIDADLSRRSRGRVWRRLRGRSLTAAVLEQAGVGACGRRGRRRGSAGRTTSGCRHSRFSGAGAAVLAVAAALGIAPDWYLCQVQSLDDLLAAPWCWRTLPGPGAQCWPRLCPSPPTISSSSAGLHLHGRQAARTAGAGRVPAGRDRHRRPGQTAAGSVELVRSRAGAIRSQYEFARKLSGTAKLDDLLWAVASQIATAVGGDTSSCSPRDRTGAARHRAARRQPVWTAACWAMTHHGNRPAGAPAAQCPAAVPPAAHRARPTSTIGFEPAGPALTGERRRMR
jgi:two-component system sensor histidine kinase KdpD